ncbi:uncharacterized protein EI97DRAFT_495741 [Westerdykella ornata]|uniref:Aminoglycoside phosphotransferase domain-containing protein n=1 Tax=Westerdykella ornata TaxID=318751 RepID=A0A6A6JC44_WESOR|nr:uncharacterized protein EI97DRAFT_495741 [Westerdykella ornata]KAF2273784.1 hypothetical protein EI97DRAFT_495741 [Westerdykella ornata]
MTQDEAVSALLAHDIDGPTMPIARYMIKTNRRSREISSPEPLVLSESELEEAILAATGQSVASSTRFTDGELSISYKVTVRESPDIAYVVQLRHHGCVASMDALMILVSRTIDPHTLPVHPVYPIPGEMERQKATGIGREINRLIPGVMASTPHLIGELIATESDGQVVLKIGPDRHHGLGGPFSSQQGIEEYKERFLDHSATVEDNPIVAMHADMGLHNIIVSSHARTDIQAVIDWEFAASAPYASLHRIIEMLFRRPAPNGFGLEYDRAEKLRFAFWRAIPEWKQWKRSNSIQAFLEWFRFGLFLKPDWRPNDLPRDEKEEFWRENVRVVESLLNKYS